MRGGLWNSDAAGFFKDAFHERIVDGHTDRVNAAGTGTKAGIWYQGEIAAGGTREYRVRLASRTLAAPFSDFDATLEQRRREADEYYAELQQGIVSADERVVQRQAFAGLIWSKQFYHFDVRRWLMGGSRPARASRITPAWPRRGLAHAE